MKNLNICIDIDGTITDTYYWLDLCNQYFNKSISEEEVTEYLYTQSSWDYSRGVCSFLRKIQV